MAGPACLTLDLAQHGEWQMLALPTNGQLRAAVPIAQPLSEVTPNGWPKKTMQ